MSQYYFLVASLPMLQYDLPPGISSEGFGALCAEHLSPGDLATLPSASLRVWETEPSHPLLVRWYRWEISLRNELVRLRAQARGLEAEGYLIEMPLLRQENAGADVVMCENLAREAFGQSDAGAAEELMNRGRWQFLEGLELGQGIAGPREGRRTLSVHAFGGSRENQSWRRSL